MIGQLRDPVLEVLGFFSLRHMDRPFEDPQTTLKLVQKVFPTRKVRVSPDLKGGFKGLGMISQAAPLDR